MCAHVTFLIIFLLFLWDSIYSSSSVAFSSSKMKKKLSVLSVLGQGWCVHYMGMTLKKKIIQIEDGYLSPSHN